MTGRSPSRLRWSAKGASPGPSSPSSAVPPESRAGTGSASADAAEPRVGREKADADRAPSNREIRRRSPTSAQGAGASGARRGPSLHQAFETTSDGVARCSRNRGFPRGRRHAHCFLAADGAAYDRCRRHQPGQGRGCDARLSRTSSAARSRSSTSTRSVPISPPSRSSAASAPRATRRAPSSCGSSSVYRSA